MESVLLPTPSGVVARLGDDHRVSLHDRRRILARQLVCEAMRLDPDEVHVERDAPTVFGYHTRLFAFRRGDEEPLAIAISTASHADATVVAVSAPTLTVGLDPVTHRGYLPDREVRYELADMSQPGYLITLAYGEDPDERSP